MHDSDSAQQVRTAVMVTMALLATALLAAWIVSLAPEDESWRTVPGREQRPENPVQPSTGVTSRLTAGGVTVQRMLASPMIALEKGETLDHRLPAGPFRAEMEIPIDARSFGSARFGVEVAGGSVTLSIGGHELLAISAGDQAEQAWSESVPFDADELIIIRCIFEREGEGACRLRVLWKPDAADLPHAVAVRGRGWLSRDAVARGLALVQMYNCAACHRSDDAALQGLLTAAPAPNLDETGASVRPQWLRQWIADPRAIKPDATMPAVLADIENRSEVIEDIVHFLMAQGRPTESNDAPVHPRLAEEGMLLYYSIGCFACHGEVETMDEPSNPFASLFASIPDQRSKTTLPRLAAFLRDPLRRRPAGRMPSMKLTQFEADAIAAYLIDRETAQEPTSFTPDPQRIERGRASFIEHGCGTCHEIGGMRANAAATFAAPPLESITANPESGCMDADEDAPGVRYAMVPSDRRTLVNFLESFAGARSGVSTRDKTTATLIRLNCMKCHTMHGDGGPGFAVRDFFQSRHPDDQRDEGRFPPTLTDIGARLKSDWIDAVLTAGAGARPHLAARMPQYGEANVGELAGALQQLAAVDTPVTPPPMDEDAAATGRDLVGVSGFNCIECHAIDGQPSVRLPGVDLALMPDRLRYRAFHRFVNDPVTERPGTGMPLHLADEDDAARQIDAIWMYLTDVPRFGLPDGPAKPGEKIVTIEDEPVVIRAFSNRSGHRVIACGTPQGVSFAFDIESSELAMIWSGDFYREGGLLRGAAEAPEDGEAPPSRPDWIPPMGPAFIAQRVPMIGWQLEAGALRFGGFEIQNDGLPVFMYELVDATSGSVARIGEAIEPVATGAGVIRRFSVQSGSLDVIWFNLGGQELVEIDLPADDALNPAARGDGLLRVPLRPGGPTTFTIRIDLTHAD